MTPANRNRTPEATRAMTPGQLAAGRKLRARIGADAPVAYLTYGTVNYLARRPSTC